MAQITIYEIGDSLETLAIKARQWFITNNVEVPAGAKKWQKCSVRRGEIPPGTGVTSIRRYGFNLTELISYITGSGKRAYIYSPIMPTNSVDLVGMEIIQERIVNGHKRVLTKCACCAHEEELDYGTLQRMRASSNRFCRYCRNAGGKPKTIDTYDIFDGFMPVSMEDSRLKYVCQQCTYIIERTLAHVSTAEYLVCEKCFPKLNFGARHYTELGYFDSKIEYEAYKTILKYLDQSLVIRQKKYSELFNTGTKHTADFYIPSINLVLEVTSSNNNIGQKYKETAEWKMSLSTSVKFAYSLSEVEDIVRSAMKVAELTVDHG